MFEVSELLFVSLVKLGLKFGDLFGSLLLLLLVTFAGRFLQSLNFCLNKSKTIKLGLT